MTQKSSDAFRTISEVAEHLDIPPHVLRFWETKFSTLRPLKRSGGRRAITGPTTSRCSSGSATFFTRKVSPSRARRSISAIASSAGRQRGRVSAASFLRATS